MENEFGEIPVPKNILDEFGIELKENKQSKKELGLPIIPNDQLVEAYKPQTDKIISTETPENIKNMIKVYFSTGFRRKSPIKIAQILPYLTKEQFEILYYKESERWTFGNKNYTYYEALLEKLESLKPFFEKKDYKKMEKLIEEKLNDNFRNQKGTYFDAVIENDPQYKKILNLLSSKEPVFTYTKLDKENTYFHLYDQSKIKSNQEISKEAYITFSISNEKLIKILKHELDIIKFLRLGIRGRGAKEKLEKLLKHLETSLIPLFAIIFKNKDKDKLEKLELFKKRLDSLNGKGEIDKKLYRAVKLEINNLSEINNNKLQYETILRLFENDFGHNVGNANTIITSWMKTKKTNYLLEGFIAFLTENRVNHGGKKYTNRKNITMILDKLEKRKVKSKYTVEFINRLNLELTKVESLIRKKTTSK